MKKRLIISNIFVVFFSMIVLLFISCFIVSESNFKRTSSQIKSYLNIACNIYDGSNQDKLTSYFSNNKNIRITIIDKTGKVIFDTEKNTEENHLSRQEITSLGQVTCRYSTTLNISMYYVAAEDSNNYIRIALPENSVNYIVQQLLIYGTLTLVIICVLTIFISINIINQSMEPLKQEIKKLSTIVGEDIPVNDSDIDFLSHQIDDVQFLINQKIYNIQEEKAKTEAIIDNLNQGFILLDDQLNTVLINKIAKKLLSYNNEKNYLYYIRSLQIQNAINNTLKEHKTHEEQIIQDNKAFIYQISPLQYQENGKNKNGISILFYDITDQYQLQKAKQDFFANASHELKSPLTTIIGYQQMISEGIIDTNEEIIDASKRTLYEAKRMNQMVIDMLELSSLESEKIINNEVNNLKDVTQNIINSYTLKLEDKHINLSTSLSDLNVKIPQKDLIHLISNLIDNAIKYNIEKGKIDININKDDNSFIIKDTGIGISKANQERVFERFYQVDKNRASDQGTGLGLSIVKHICLKYNIKLKLDSKLNKGTSITLVFPNIEKNK